jgi:S-adenosylmethionine hydrolase
MAANYKKDYGKIVQKFVEGCREAPGIYDVILRGTAVEECGFCDGWSDVDLSVVFDKLTTQAYRVVRDCLSSIREDCGDSIKISVTLVDVNDFRREDHNHGIKPLYYSALLDDSLVSLLRNEPALRERYHTVSSKPVFLPYVVTDCFCNVVYLVHDIRMRYLNTDITDLEKYSRDALHIIRRSKYVVLNSYFVITGKIIERIDEETMKEILGVFNCLEQDCFRSVYLSDLKHRWEAVSKDCKEVTQVVDTVVGICDYIYKEVCTMFDFNKKKRKKIVVFSDCTDIAFVEVHQKLIAELDRLGVASYDIAPLVEVANFSVINASFCLRLIADVSEPGTIFLVIANAQNNNPERIFGETDNGLIFVGNNSGYFSWLLKDLGLKSIYRTNIDRAISNKSFGGRNVQTPLAAQIAAEVSYDSLGTPFDRSLLTNIDIKDGTIVHIDNFGLMKMKLYATKELEKSSSVDIYVNSEFRVTAKFKTKMKTASDGEWCVFPGSSLDPPLLEIARVRSPDSAAELCARVGDVITLVSKNV